MPCMPALDQTWCSIHQLFQKKIIELQSTLICKSWSSPLHTSVKPDLNRALEEGVPDSNFKAYYSPGIRDSNFKLGRFQDSKMINQFWGKYSTQKHSRFRIQIWNRSGFSIQIWIPEKCLRFRIQIWSSRALLMLSFFCMAILWAASC